MKVSTRRAGDVVVAELVGEIDAVDTEGLGESLSEIAAEKPAGLVLDFSQVSYIASMGLSILLKLAQEMRKIKSPLVIAAVTPAVKTVLDTVHLGSAIPLETTVDGALKRMPKKA